MIAQLKFMVDAVAREIHIDPCEKKIQIMINNLNSEPYVGWKIYVTRWRLTRLTTFKSKLQHWNFTSVFISLKIKIKECYQIKMICHALFLAPGTYYRTV